VLNLLVCFWCAAGAPQAPGELQHARACRLIGLLRSARRFGGEIQIAACLQSVFLPDIFHRGPMQFFQL